MSEAMPWGQLALGFMVPAGVMVAMLNFAPVLPLIRDEFALSNVWSGVLGSATILSHTILQLPGGYVADRIGVKRALNLGLGLVVLGMFASAMATNIGFLLACRFVVGVGTAISFISGLGFVNGVTPTRRKVVVQGMFGAAANTGVLLVMLLSGWLSAWGGWRGTFLAEGLLLLAIAVVVSARLRSDVSFSHTTSASWEETLQQRYLYLLGLAHVLTYGAFTGISAWAVTFLWEKFGLALAWAGLLSAFLPAASIISRTVGGTISLGREKQSILLSTTIAAVGTGLLPLLPSPLLAVIDLAVVGWFAAMPFGAVFSYSSLVTGETTSGRDLSLINFVGNVGALLFPPAVGYALDVTGSFGLGFGFVAAVGLAGTVTIALGLPGRKRAT